jgi:cytochrome c-type biogenesis protein CcmH/NrfG
MVLRARIEMQSGDTISMKARFADLQEVLKQEPNSRPGLYFMAEANFRSGQIDQARVFVGDLERNYPDYLPSKLMLAQIDLSTGDAKAALQTTSQLLDRINKATPDREVTPQMLADLRANALMVHGSSSLQLRDTKTARADFMMAHERRRRIRTFT